MAFLVEALFSWNECWKHTDISILSNFLATYFQFFSQCREILPNTAYVPSSSQFDHSNRNYGGGGQNPPPWPYQAAKTPACLLLIYSFPVIPHNSLINVLIPPLNYARLIAYLITLIRIFHTIYIKLLSN